MDLESKLAGWYSDIVIAEKLTLMRLYSNEQGFLKFFCWRLLNLSENLANLKEYYYDPLNVWLICKKQNFWLFYIIISQNIFYYQVLRP